MNVKSRESGVALIVLVVLGAGLMLLASLSMHMALVHSISHDVQEAEFQSSQIAESAAAEALALIRQGGVGTPDSGGWIDFSEGEFYYHAAVSGQFTTVRAWGRVAMDSRPSGSSYAPDSVNWDGAGYMLNGVEWIIESRKYIPTSPMYFGNGGIERPRGGFEWTNRFKARDRKTWGKVADSPSSYQDPDSPFELSALDYPSDYLVSGGLPVPAASDPHPYNLMTLQTEFGQLNALAWFGDDAAGGNPTASLSPPPTDSYYETTDLTSADHPYPVDPAVPDVQDFAWKLWNNHENDATANKLNGGALSGTYGDLANPQITFVTGKLRVDPGSKFEGSGILVIRDDFDPNVDKDNTPSVKADLDIAGGFSWTGLVIIAGWAPSITVRNGGDATIVGSLFGEDSVQSGGEVSLDSATIVLRVHDNFRSYYSSAMFQPGGLIYDQLPGASFKIVGVRALDSHGKSSPNYSKEPCPDDPGTGAPYPGGVDVVNGVSTTELKP